MAMISTQSVNLLEALVLLLFTRSLQTEVATLWKGELVHHLHEEYYNVFKSGNRNAASHLWSSFLLDRSVQMTHERFIYMFSGICAISGSPVQPQDRTRYRLNLELVGGGRRSGWMYYCCWPCVCDTQDFIKVDTKTIQTADGPRQYHFAVIGDACKEPEKLRTSLVQQQAPEVRCSPEGQLMGAYRSDHGHIIISMFFEEDPSLTAMDESVFQASCADRAANGFNSGMGDIFRKVAAMSPVNALLLTGGENCSVVLDSRKEDQPAADSSYILAESLHCGMSQSEEVQPAGPPPGGASFFQDAKHKDRCRMLCDDSRQCVAFQVKTGEACWLYRQRPREGHLSISRTNLGWLCGVKQTDV